MAEIESIDLEKLEFVEEKSELTNWLKNSLLDPVISSLSFMIKTFLQLENCGLREYVSDGTKESFCSEKVGSERRHQSMLMASPGLFSISRFPAMMKKIHVKAFQLVKKNFLEAFKENMGVIVLDKRECEK